MIQKLIIIIIMILLQFFAIMSDLPSVIKWVESTTPWSNNSYNS